MRKMPSSSPIYIPLIVQSLCKNNGVDWNCLLDKPTIVLSFQDDRPENSPKMAIFGHKIGRSVG